jgi:hypothetical protein
VAARLAVLALAVFLAGFGAIARHDARRCEDAGRPILRVGLGSGERVSDGTVDDFADACRGSHLLAVGADVLARTRQLPPAIRLSDEAIRREPENFEGWLALSRTLRRRGLDAAADRAQRRVRELNPRFGRRPG